jgi:creatinine amidohydrolase
MDYQSLKGDEIRAYLNADTVALLPLGAVEFHAAHLPLGTDNFLAAGIAQKVAEKLERALVLPTLPYGQVWSTRDFPGTISVRNEILTEMIVDIGRSLYQHDIWILAIINTHMGNLDAMKAAARILYEEEMKLLYLTYPGVEAVQEQVLESPRIHSTYFHACEIETSYMLYVAPEHVDMEKAIKDEPVFPMDFNVTPTPWTEITRTGVLGDATLATRKKGQAMIDATVENMVKVIEKVREDVRKGR